MRFSIATFALAAIASAATLVSGATIEARAVDISAAKKNGSGKCGEVSAERVESGLAFDSIAKGSLDTTGTADSLLANYDVLYACDGYNFTGACWYIGVANFGGCFNLPPFVDNTFSSIVELYTNVGCNVFTELNCGGLAGYIDYNTGYIGAIAPPFDNSISSLQCLILF